MDEKHKVVVKLNHKIIETDAVRDNTSPNWYEEQAASLDMDDELSELEYKNIQVDRKLDSSKHKKHITRLIFTVSMALCIGISLGFVALKMFVAMDETNSRLSTNEGSSKVEEINQPVDEKGETKDIVIAGLDAFVVQIGMFSTTEKAEEAKNQMTEQAGAIVAWQEEEGIRLFASVHATKAEAEKRAGELSSEYIDGYVREWTTSEQTVTFPQAEVEWIEDFSPLWKNTIEKSSDYPAMKEESENWKKWLSTAPSELSKPLETMKTTTEELVSRLHDSQSIISIYEPLLELWYLYSKL